MKTIDHADLLREQVKILSGEVALHYSILKRLSDEAAKSPNKEHIQVNVSANHCNIFVKTYHYYSYI